VVHLKGGVVHAHPLNTLLELVVEYPARAVGIFIIYPIWQNEVQKNIAWYFSPPAEVIPSLNGGTHLIENIAPIVHGQVTQRHKGVEELQPLPLLNG
jgi:hypothetical protein